MKLQFLTRRINSIKLKAKLNSANNKECKTFGCCLPEELQVSAEGLWGFIAGTQSFFWSSPKMLSIEKEQGEGLLSPCRAPSWRLGDMVARAAPVDSGGVSVPLGWLCPTRPGLGSSCSSPYGSSDKGVGFRMSLIKILSKKVLACQWTPSQQLEELIVYLFASN